MKNKFRIFYTLALSATTIVLVFVMYHLGTTASIKQKASVLLDKEVIKLNGDYSNLQSEKSLLSKQKNELAKQVNENSDISKEIELTV